jgi:hypothetical protein
MVIAPITKNMVIACYIGCLYGSALGFLVTYSHSFFNGTTVSSIELYLRIYIMSLVASSWYIVGAPRLHLLYGNDQLSTLRTDWKLSTDMFLLTGVVYPYIIYSSADTILLLTGFQDSTLQTHFHLIPPSGIILTSILEWSKFHHFLRNRFLEEYYDTIG